MSVAVEHGRFQLTATIEREGILIQFWISRKTDAVIPLGDDF